MGDVFRYVPGVLMHQGEGNRDQIVIRGVSTTADFYVDGVRDDAQVFRDLYNLERVEVLKGPAGMIFRPRQARRRGQPRDEEASIRERRFAA
jgi:catecholate siderophore receptor